MTCADVMTKDPTCCVPTDTASRAAKLMKTADVGSIPVCQSRDSRKLVGIVTDRDIVIQVIADGRDVNSIHVQDVMTKDPFICHPEDKLDEALKTMQLHQLRRIPVVDFGGQLVGIIAQADIATRSEEPQKTAETLGRVSTPSARGAH